MPRPVRPVALVILTACMLYPGVSLLYQGGYPFVTNEWFTLLGQRGPWMDLAQKMGIPLMVVAGAKLALGAAWLFGVLGLWAGDNRAFPLVLLAAAGSLLYPGGPMVMGVIGLICLLFFREKPGTVPA
jgi:hypothetical protein